MTKPELLQLIDRVENDLANNWAVDKDDIQELLHIAYLQNNEDWHITAERSFDKYTIKADWMSYKVFDDDNVMQHCDASEDGVFHNIHKAEVWIIREKIRRLEDAL